MKFISAGHHDRDPGAVSKYGKEAQLAKKVRDRVIQFIKSKTNCEKVVQDMDRETLGQYLRRIKPGNGSVVVEFHFNASSNSSATGTEVLVENEADRLDFLFAKELAEATSLILNIKNRGVKKESQSHRGRLGLMREEGIIALVEVCFLTNKEDMEAFYNPAKFEMLCSKYADIIIKYDNLIK